MCLEKLIENLVIVEDLVNLGKLPKKKEEFRKEKRVVNDGTSSHQKEN